MNKQLTAASLDAATQYDAQFRIPARPAVISAVPTTWLQDAFVIEGAVSRRVLRGRTVQSLLPDLLPLLDGSRTWNDLAETAAVPKTAIRQILGILYAAGLLEEGKSTETTIPTPLVDFLSRTFDATRQYRSGHEAAAALSSSHAAIICEDSDLRKALLSELQENSITVVSVDELRGVKRPLLIAVTSSQDLSVLSRTSAQRSEGIPILSVTLGAQTVTVGPVSYPDYNPCPSCIAAASPSSDSAHKLSDETCTVTAEELLPALIAHEVVLLLAGVGNARSMSEAVVVSRVPLYTKFEVVVRRPDCPACGSTSSEDGPSAAFAYEESVAFPPARLTKPRTHQQHFEPSNIALSTEQRSHRGEAIPLNVISDSNCCTLDASAIAQILSRAFGLKPPHLAPPGKVRRWAPTGGNLGSPQAYFATRNICGVPDGRWVYHGDESIAYRVSESTCASDGMELVIVAELYRVWKKYNTFAYRIAALDAGVVLAHIAAVTTGIGAPMTNMLGWDSAKVITEYNLDKKEQMVVGITHIGSPS
ncbi:hypothetical protein [Rathayibacter tritici]|uniref:Nitroreductase domain-containing protein n=1 Tax=Rathayibacter tritici TaxID=33888 RepID=A0A160KV33_9MICO|nr:hypothetical protein [Rathayibacter tritici]AND17573.1 hypothetical protein A6122_2457 [Rathayibacter tritici]